MSHAPATGQKKSSPRGLGRGINILIPDITDEPSGEAVLKLSINEIEPNRQQPRRVFDEDALRELAESISEHGVIQPLIVRKSDGYYEIVAGERRWRAARLAGIAELPVIVRECGERDSFEVALIENIQRENLSATEEAFAYRRLADEFNLTQDEIAERVGKKRSTIANSIRLLNLPEDVLNMLDEGKISAGHAKALLSLDDENRQIEAAMKIADMDLSVRQAEEMIKALTAASKKEREDKKASAASLPYYRDIEKSIGSLLGTRVKLTAGRNKSKIEIDFFSDEDLDRLVGLFKKLED